ncbi:SIS domain-containing protein [Leuconostoc falkenbergense]|uniref:SIS domain-containing protein n=1 Tax=Leuconostoc falkenbergense TaxID=2766470 RepID=UPI00293C5701|nr:SIS domain-containing protein [Leuconostoc falkenbergense]MDV3545406.1 SIS domain-containing protein [Leuconostoc falkenbergense]
MSILNRFEKSKILLSNSELSIFEQIWTNLANLQGKTLTEMTDAMHISRQSFLRIAKKLGYKDSNEFLLDLNRQTVFADITTTAMVQPSVLEQNIHHIINHFDTSQIKKIIDSVEKSERIFLIATGKAQRNQANILSKILIKHGYFVVQIYDLFEVEEIKNNMHNTDLVIVLTRTGTSNDLLNAVRSINQTNARIITVTSLRSNPISNWSNFTVFVNTQKIDGNVYELNSLFYGLFELIDFYLTDDSITKQTKDKQELVQNLLSNYMVSTNDHLSINDKELLLNFIQSPDLVFTSISNISQKLNVSTTTLFRLSKALGFKGFKESRSSIGLEIRDFLPNSNQYDSYQTLIKNFNQSVNDIMSTDFSIAHKLISKYNRICIIYHDQYSEILADELIRMFFHTDKLMQKINGQHDSKFISERKDTLFIFLITSQNGETDFVQTASKINYANNEIVAFANKDTNILGYKVSGKVFFKSATASTHYFSDMWLLEFFFISYFYQLIFFKERIYNLSKSVPFLYILTKSA